MLPRNAYSSDEEFLSALRDTFAGQAILAAGASAVDPRRGADLAALAKAIAEGSFAIADALLAERAKGGDQ